LLISAAALGIGLVSHSEHLIIGALISGVAKGLLIPYALIRVLRSVSERTDTMSLLAPGQALLVTLALTALAYRSAPHLLPGMGDSASTRLAAALALILIGLYIMIARRSAISQVIGLMVMENGIYLAAMAATYGMPLVVELGILFDALLGVLVMALLVAGMHRHLDTTDTASLRSLKG
jgi:hydrogenase-4 component E